MRREKPSDEIKKFTGTFSLSEECQHMSGWYVYPKFWIFTKRFLCCSVCGKLLGMSKWFIDW